MTRTWPRSSRRDVDADVVESGGSCELTSRSLVRGGTSTWAVDDRVVGATIERSGVRAAYGTDTVTFTKLPAGAGGRATVASVTSVQVKVIVLDGQRGPGTSFFWVLIVPVVSALLPSVQVFAAAQGWTAVVRAISRAASVTPLLM